MNIIAALRTPVATLIVLCMALLAQLPHAADVFRMIVAGEGWQATLHGYAYAIALELAVLLFVVQRRDLESYMFAGVSILVNLSYYSLHGINLFSVAALPAWLVSIALPAAIARYSHLLVETPEPVIVSETTRHNAHLRPVEAPVSASMPAMVQVDAGAQPDAPSADLPEVDAAPDKRKQAERMKSENLSNRQIALQLSVDPATVGRWLKQSATHTNGAQHG